METKLVQRKYDLDWLRVIAIFLVFVYHCSMIFAPDPFQIKNPVIYQYIDDISAFVGLWGMPLIFIVSGASVFHALGKHSPGKYITGMIARLLVPLVVGIFTHCALQVYVESIHKGTFTGSFFAFYPHYFDGMYAFGGNFAWMGMHLWYLEALFLYSMLCLPLYLWLKTRTSGQRLLGHLGDFLGKPGAIYLLALPAILLINLFDPDGLGTSVLGGWSIFNYLFFFISGFLIISSAKLQANIRRLRWVSLAAGIIIWGIFDIIWGALGDPSFGTWQYAIGTIFWCLCAWCMLLSVLGIGFQYLNRNTTFLRYANDAVLPFYILHQSIILPLAFFVVQWAIPDLLKFLIILSASFMVVMVLYEFLVRRVNPLRFLFGMKPLLKVPSAQTEPQVVEPAQTA
jgi:peptidoglycan/LPS O-acetylase OafA/YrhL